MDSFSNIDTSRWLRPDQDVLLLSGWAFLSGKAPSRWTNIRLRTANGIHLGYYGTPRPDVQNAYPKEPNALFCGFSFLVFEAKIVFPCLLEATDLDGHTHHVCSLEATQVAPPPSHAVSGLEVMERLQVMAEAAPSRSRSESVSTQNPRTGKPVLFISHDFAYAGAQIILLRLLRWLRLRDPFPIEVLINVPRNASLYSSVTEREILNGFLEIGPVHFLSDLTGAPENLPLIRSGYYSLLYANTSTLGVLLAALQPCPIPVLSHVYELAFWIERRTSRAVFERQSSHTDRFIACSQAVRDVLVNRMAVPSDKIDVIYACASTERARLTRLQHTQESVRHELGIPLGTFVVEACGTFDWRKGAELLVPLAVALRRRLQGRDFRVIWIGDHGPQIIKDQFEHEVEYAGLGGKVQLIAPQQNLPWWMLAADCFALLSREDPFAMVMLEAGTLGLPVVGFDGSGGVKEYAESGAGIVVPYLDLEAYADALAVFADQPAIACEIGARAEAQIAKHYDHEISFQRTLDLVLSTRTPNEIA